MIRCKWFLMGLACVAAVYTAAPARADLVVYTENFESMSPAGSGDLANAGWKVFGNAYSPSNTYIYGYGPFGAPNGGPGFSAVATGEGGPAQGNFYINTYNDYNNADHNGSGNRIEALIFQEQFVGAGDIGKTVRFSFDYRAASAPFGPASPSTANAFVKVLDSIGSTFATLGEVKFETTNASNTDWARASVELMIDSSWSGQLLQFGFMNDSIGYSPTGVFYDNLSFTAIPEPSSMALCSLAAIGLAVRRRRR